MIKDKLPTRVQLQKRRNLNDSHDIICVFCFNEDECIDHLIIHFPVIKQVWKNIWFWIDIEDVEIDQDSRCTKE